MVCVGESVVATNHTRRDATMIPKGTEQRRTHVWKCMQPEMREKWCVHSGMIFAFCCLLMHHVVAIFVFYHLILVALSSILLPSTIACAFLHVRKVWFSGASILASAFRDRDAWHASMTRCTSACISFR